MNITATGSSSLTALYLQRLLGSSSTVSDDDTGDSSGTADILSISSAAQTASAQGADPFKADLDKLESALSSGDLGTAKSTYAAMLEQMKQHGEVPSDFKALGDALDSGDTAAATSALSTVKSNVAAQAPPPPPSGGSNPLKNDLDQLSALLGSGDTSSAQTLFDTILGKAQGLSSDSSTSDTVTSLTAALASGDTASASTALADLLARLQAQAATSTHARSMESVAAAAYGSVAGNS